VIDPKSIGIVDVSGWAADEDNPIFPVGSQPKKLLVCPEDNDFPGLISGHRYLFKKAEGWQAGQLWAEIFASQFSHALAVDVPPAFVGRDADGTFGALIEFFFGYPKEEAPDRFFHASDLLQRSLIDKKRGRPHSLRSNLNICRALGIADAREWWAKTLVFDALIGNTDRHPDNWGFLARVDKDRQRTFRLAPAFDNGTSLGYERTEQSISQPWGDVRLAAYVDRGTHHCSWIRSDDRPAQHAKLVEALVLNYPDTSQTARNMIRFDPARVTEITEALCQVDCALAFTKNRARFVEHLINARQRKLMAVLEI
jgi:hypothetical protein